jgi:hypothetical protein
VKHAVLPALVLLALGLTACGGGSSADPTAQLPVVQPCDHIDTAKLGTVLGYAMTKHTGTADAPSCALTPVVTGGVIFSDVNYQWWYQGGLEDAWKTMSASIQGTVSTVTIAGADDAKLVVRKDEKAAYVTGFLENGRLVQVVNGLARPQDVAKLTAATTEIMTELSAGAPSTPSAPPSA